MFRTRRIRSIACAIALSAIPVAAQESALTPGAQILAPFKQTLLQALRTGLEQGPVEAISVCQLEAPQIAGDLSRDGVRVGRTSHRLRNPANAIPVWVAPILDAYERDASAMTPQTVSIRPDLFGYVEPIVVQPLCLTCHGENLEPAVAARIDELYPGDRAVGYKLGELRGVFWVEYPTAD
jgi:hypothetical protein